MSVSVATDRTYRSLAFRVFESAVVQSQTVLTSTTSATSISVQSSIDVQVLAKVRSCCNRRNFLYPIKRTALSISFLQQVLCLL
jgi:hypothetical protein